MQFPQRWLQPQQNTQMPQMQQQGGFLDMNMDGIDDRIFSAQQRQTELEMQAKLQSLQAKREQQYWTNMKKVMMDRQRQAEQQAKQAAMNQPAGQFGQQWNQFQDVRRNIMGQNSPQLMSPLAGDGSFQRSYTTPEGSLPRNTAQFR